MTNQVRVVVATGKADRRLAAAARELRGGGPLVRQCLDALGQQGLTETRKRFTEHSRPGDAFWKRLSVPTVILRPGGPKIYGPEDVETKRAGLKKMRVSGLLLDSLRRGRPGNVFRLGDLEVEVGTRDRRAGVLHGGGMTEPFVFDEEKRKRFDRNVSKTKRGFRKPRALKSGKRRKWKALGKESPWNAFYYVWKNVFRKWAKAGRRAFVPARAIVEPASPELMTKLKATVRRFLSKIAGEGR